MKSLNSPVFLTPHWDDYELIDCGGFEKLERFGRWITIRPEPQALWNKSLPEKQWQQLATALFRREAGNLDRGQWILRDQMPQQWYIDYKYKDIAFSMRLGLTSFKHVGVFPEQAENWNFICDTVRSLTPVLRRKPNVLNLFAYTGGASLAAAAAGADVTHVDAVKQVVSWARENAEHSNLTGIRWIVDDAMKFVNRELRRGKLYDGIVLDPPAYGRGPAGEKWLLEQQLNEMLTACSKLLNPAGGFLVLNLYSMGLSALLAKSLVEGIFPDCKKEEFGELYFCDRGRRMLPLGVFYRSVY